MFKLRPGIPVSTVAGLVLISAFMATPAVAGQRRDRPNRIFEVKPWRPSRDLVDWQEVRPMPPRPSHYLWQSQQLETARERLRRQPGLPPGRQVGDEEMQIEDHGGMVTSRAPTRVGSFEGLDVIDSGFGRFIFFPPDTHVAASGNRILEVTNVAARLSGRTGGGAVIRSLYNFFSIDPETTVFDPKVYFDRLSGRFFMVVLNLDETRRRSFIYLAVSRSSSPNALNSRRDFCTYRIKAKRRNSYADYPGIGVNEKWFAISVNNFWFGGGGLFSPFVYAIDVKSLTRNTGSCPGIRVSRFKVRWDPDGRQVFTLQPAQHYTQTSLPGTPLFLVSTQPVLSSDRYMLARLESQGDGPPILEKSMLTGSTYTPPPPAGQRDGPDLDSGDMRIMQVAYRSGSLWAVMATGCDIAGEQNESCIRALRIAPGEGEGSITFEDTFGRANGYFYWPGIAVNQRGDVVVTFQRSTNNQYLGVGFNGKRAAADAFDPNVKNLKKGFCPIEDFDGSLYRTGDYTGAQTDPLDNVSFFIAGEYASRFGAEACEWRTRVGRVRY
jgi:hypothetical protein